MGYISDVLAKGLRPLSSKPESLTDMVFEAIRDAMVSKALPPGGQVSEASLAAQLNVSKTPVRETLLRLRHAGLVESDGRTLRVVVPSSAAIQNAYELRSGLEQTAVWHAVQRATKEEKLRIRELAEFSYSAASSGSSDEFFGLDQEFHRAIAEASHNPLVAEAVGNALLLTAVLRARDVPAGDDSVICATEHVQIAETVQDGDGNAAMRRMREHVEHVLAIVLSHLGESAAES